MRRALPYAWLISAATAAGAALWHIVAIARIFVADIAYPIQLEVLEGLVLYQAHRILQLEPLYHAPGHGFVPQTHPPLHTLVLAAVGRVFGLDYATGRALSVAFFAIACAVTWRVIARQFHERRWGVVFAVVAIGMAASSGPTVLGWYDLARDDSMALALTVLAGAVAASESMTWRRVVCLGIVLTAMGFTRLTTAFPIAWIVATVIWRSRRHGVALAAGVAVAAAVTVLALQWASDGWFWTYTVGLHAHHQVSSQLLLDGILRVLRYAPFLVAVPFAVAWLAHKRQLRRPTVIWIGLLATAVPSALLPYMKQGGAMGDLVPLVFLCGPTAMLVASDVLHAMASYPMRTAAVRATVLGLAAVLLIARTYDVGDQLPARQMVADANALVAAVAALDGSVMCPSDPFLPVQSGHDTEQISNMAYVDLWWAGYPDLQQVERDDITRIAATWVVSDDQHISAALRESYEYVTRLAGIPQRGAGPRGVSFVLLHHR
jgi:hypothetical protein